MTEHGAAMNQEPIHIPVEVKNPPAVFNTVSKGYDRRQVDEHILQLEQEIAELSWLREFWESHREAIEREHAQLAEERAAFEAEKGSWQPSFTALGDRAQQILHIAEAEADALRRRCLADCEEQRAKQEAESAEWREQFERESTEARAELRQELNLLRREVEAESARILHEAHIKSDGLLEESRHQAEAIRVDALEHLSIARQEREKVARQLVELMGRIQSASSWLSEDLVTAAALYAAVGNSDNHDSPDSTNRGSTETDIAEKNKVEENISAAGNASDAAKGVAVESPNAISSVDPSNTQKKNPESAARDDQDGANSSKRKANQKSNKKNTVKTNIDAKRNGEGHLDSHDKAAPDSPVNDAVEQLGRNHSAALMTSGCVRVISISSADSHIAASETEQAAS